MITIRQLQKDIGTWSDTTFPHATIQGQIKKLIEECNEWLDHPHDKSEQADVQLLVLDICRRCKTDADTLLRATQEKLEINKLRKWGPPDADGKCRHID